MEDQLRRWFSGLIGSLERFFRQLGTVFCADPMGNNTSGKQIQNDADVVILVVESVIGYIADPDLIRLLRIKLTLHMVFESALLFFRIRPWRLAGHWSVPCPSSTL